MKDQEDKRVPAWPEDRLAYRLERCRAMLNLHGMITPKENEWVQQRLKKQFPYDVLYSRA